MKHQFIFLYPPNGIARLSNMRQIVIVKKFLSQLASECNIYVYSQTLPLDLKESKMEGPILHHVKQLFCMRSINYH